MIPLFDSLTHPTLDGSWIKGSSADIVNSFDNLVAAMPRAGIRWAFAVGMGRVGGYDAVRYADAARRAGRGIFPVAWYEPGVCEHIDELKRLRALGYVGLKIHPRHAGLSLGDPSLPRLLDACNDAGLVPMLCTYFATNDARTVGNCLDDVGRLLAAANSKTKCVLVHAGASRLLEAIDLARAFPSILLDLSFTLCKYEGSSIDLDMRYAFKKFNQRICVGSDAPEFSLDRLRDRFEEIGVGVPEEKLRDIGYRNILKFFALPEGEPT